MKDCCHPTSQVLSNVPEPLDAPANSCSGTVIARELAKDRDKYLSFISRRLSDHALGEDIFQTAFIRAVEKSETLRSPAALQGWFYGILRNAVIDAQRRRASSARALTLLASDMASEMHTEKEDLKSPCQCVGSLANQLKPEYRSALLRIDVEGLQVKAYAEEQGLTANHAGVRVHRARHALRERVTSTCGECAADGCQNCTCEKA